jgi:hypothetical protein
VKLGWSTAGWSTVRTYAALIGLVGSFVWVIGLGRPVDARWSLLIALGVCWALFGVAAHTLRQAPERVVPAVVLLGGVALQLVAVSVPPRTSDDQLRYAWDGRVSNSGVSPYRYSPGDKALAALRDDWLFSPGRDCGADPADAPACPRLNHPAERTIYPPVAQGYFAAVDRIAPTGLRTVPWQVAAALLATAVTAVLLWVLRRTGRPLWRAALWAWCPAVAYESGNNAHVDVLAVLLVVAGFAVMATAARPEVPAGLRPLSRRGVVAATLLALAVATKLLPLLVLPAVVRLRRFRHAALTGVVVAVVITAVYLPSVIAVGIKAVGFLPGYLAEEGFDGSGRFAVVRSVVPTAAAPYVAAAVIGAVAVWAMMRGDPSEPWRAAVPVVGVTFIVLGPAYPWYALLLVGLVALDGRGEWLVVAAAAYPAYFVGALGLHHGTTQMAGYWSATAAVAGTAIYRHVLRRRVALPVTAVS